MKVRVKENVARLYNLNNSDYQDDFCGETSDSDEVCICCGRSDHLELFDDLEDE